MNMYEVCAKCGHVGRDYYVEKTFAVKAESAKEAAAVVRWFPRVKHHHKDAIRFVTEVDVSRYTEIITANSEDAYFHCKNVQEQRGYSEMLFPECPKLDYDVYNHSEPNKRDYYCGKTKIKNPKKYMGFIKEEGRLSVC